MASSQNIGIDIVDISRFRKLSYNPLHPFILRVFSAGERGYCSRYIDQAVHYAGMFAAREAASKSLGVKEYPALSLEVCHNRDGSPVIVGREGVVLPVKVSISHDGQYAIAMAIS